MRTTTLDTVVYGKSKSTNQRSIPGALFDESSSSRHWGWAKGRITSDPGEKIHSSGGQLEYTENDEINVYIQDSESAHDRNEIVLRGSTIQNGDLVMDNIYGDGDGIDNEDDDASMDDDCFSDEEGRKEECDKYPDDLIILTHLHEPSVVYCLRKRYARDKIYTSTGPILIALNPFKNCKVLYSEAMMKKYWNRGKNRMLGIASESSKANETHSTSEDRGTLPPHVYGIADDSFRKMMSKLEESASNNSSSGGRRRRPPSASSSSSTLTSSSCNQSILVSGESGAGKTVTTKYIMQYLATLSKRSSHPDETTKALPSTGSGEKEKVDMEQQVLQSNPILESFGNARTIRNDNSSRFGKFIEIQFTDIGHLAGASIETYLLEKVRLISQTEGERNYHIFYELLEGLPEKDLDRYFLIDYDVDDFLMTNQSGTYDRRDGVSDNDTFQDLLAAMETMDFSKDEQTDIFAITSALLHSSNLTFKSITADESEIDRDNKHLEAFLSLMGLSVDDLNRALCYFSITAGKEKHMRSNSKEKAEKGLLALIKGTYGALFTHVVKRVNDSIAISHSKKSKRSEHIAAAASIGVLDIFGFESFKTNSFEQLCINYCNEALQHQFNLFVLKNEQEEYEREGIAWSYVVFPDNQDVLDLISKKGAGILSILDDQCRAPGTTDKTFINDLYQKVSRHKRFEADYRQVGARKFAIIHYAGTVEYESEGFVEKNRDELPKEATELLLSSSNKFVKRLAEIISGGSPSSALDAKKGRSGPKSKYTVGGQFSRQLQELRQKIDLTTPHYIRCLKPNDELEPDNFNPLVVADQLRCAGVIEAVRVSRLGYPQRYSHSRFVSRYRILGLRPLKKSNASSRKRKPVDVLVDSIVEKIVEVTGDTGERDLSTIGIQVGKTKVFFRRNAYETIERLLNLEMRRTAITIQSIARQYVARRGLVEAKYAIISLQCLYRSNAACRLVHKVRCEHNAAIIQKSFRRFLAHKRFQSIRYFCKSLQCLHRGITGRQLYRILNRDRKATSIQQAWRMYKACSGFKEMKIAAIAIQCAVRCTAAKNLIGKLKKAARDLQNTSSERDQFREENKKLGKALADAMANIAELLTNNPLKEELHSRTVELSAVRQNLDAMETSCARERERAEEAESSLSDINLEREQILELRAHVSQLEELYQLKEEESSKCHKDIDMLKDELHISISANADLIESEGTLIAEIETSNDARESLEKELKTTNKELQESRAKIEDFKHSTINASQELTALNASSQGEIVELHRQIHDSHSCLEAIRGEKMALEQNLVDATEKLVEASTEIAHLRRAVEVGNGEQESTIHELVAISAENERLAARLKTQLKEMEALQKIETKIQRLEVVISRKENEIAQLRQEGGNANEHFEKLRAEISTYEQDLADASNEIVDLKQTIDAEKETSQSASEVLVTLQEEKEDLTATVETQLKDIEALRTIKAEKTLLEDEIRNFREDLSNVDKGEIECLRVKLERITSEVQLVTAERESLAEDMHRVRKGLDNSEVSVKELKGNLDVQVANTASIMAENDVLHEKLRKQERDFETFAVLKAEKEKLAKTAACLQIELKEKEMAILDGQRMQDLESKASKEMDTILNPMNGKVKIISETPMYSFDDSEGNEEDNATDAEIANLKDIIEILKAELKASPADDPAVLSTSSDGEADPEQLIIELTRLKESTAEEILTLQDEVERLNQEISDQSSIQSSIPHPRHSGDSHHVSKLIDSIMVKDEEIRDLRREIAILRDQVDSSTISIMTESQSQMCSRAPDDDDRSIISKFFTRGPHRAPLVVNSKDGIQLQSLRHELADVKAERDELKITLQEEKEKVDMELASFSGALQGVDELRQAAEKMSREITRLKNQKDDEVPEDPFEDINNDAIEEFENKLENFDVAKGTIGTASLQSETTGLWGKLRRSEMQYRSRRRGKEYDDDDNASIFSSFF